MQHIRKEDSHKMLGRVGFIGFIGFLLGFLKAAFGWAA
jgi:hypothetical protein